MNTEQQLLKRSSSSCELCGNNNDLQPYQVDPKNENILVCFTCYEQINERTDLAPNHWRCLNNSMWSEVPAVQVVAWRVLNKLNAENWAQDLLDIFYLDEDTLQWAKVSIQEDNFDDKITHKDSNGAILEAGDSVVLIKDLNVKGANFIAKRGTTVKNITLVHDNEEQIEGKINGQHIVILTQFVKK